MSRGEEGLVVDDFEKNGGKTFKRKNALPPTLGNSIPIIKKKSFFCDFHPLPPDESSQSYSCRSFPWGEVKIVH